MAYEKTWRPKSTPEEIQAAIVRAIKALKGSGSALSIRTIAERANQYVPEGTEALLRQIKQNPELATLVQSAMSEPWKPPTETRPIRTGTWRR